MAAFPGKNWGCITRAGVYWKGSNAFMYSGWNDVTVVCQDMAVESPLINAQLWPVYSPVSTVTGHGLDDPVSTSFRICRLFAFIKMSRLPSGPPSLQHNSLVCALTVHLYQISRLGILKSVLAWLRHVGKRNSSVNIVTALWVNVSSDRSTIPGRDNILLSV
jgi:hypothetical protein